MDGRNEPVKLIKEGCIMTFKGVKGLVNQIKIDSLSLSIGMFALNLTGSSS